MGGGSYERGTPANSFVFVCISCVAVINFCVSLQFNYTIDFFVSLNARLESREEEERFNFN